MANTSTLLSALLRTQPAMPRMCASRSTNQRKPTPWTRPRTRKRRAWIVFSAELTIRNVLTLAALRSRQVRAFRGVDLNLLAFFCEWRHLHDESGFGLSSFGHAGSGCAFESGFGLNHGENHGL